MKWLIISIILAWVICKIIKSIIDVSKGDELTWKNFMRNGGMPSNHTALMVSLSASLFFETGFSYIFVLAVVITMIVINDAVIVRRITGEQSKIINKLATNKNKKQFSKLQERVGHTPLEVFFGGLIGFLVPIIIYLIFF